MSCQGTTTQWFHDDNSNAAGCSIRQPRKASLVVNIKDIELDLAHIPDIAVNDLFEKRQLIMERESRVPDPTVCLSPVEEFQDTQITHLTPRALVQGMQQIEINMICLQFLQLPIEQPVKVIR